MSKFRAEYKTFFESPAGNELLTFIHTQIDTEHEHAEKSNKSEEAFGHTRTAKGYRDVLEHINLMMIESRQTSR